MADSNEIQDDNVADAAGDAQSTPNDADLTPDSDATGDVDAAEAVAEGDSVAPAEVEQNAPTVEELAAREAEAALLLIFQSTVFDKNGSKIGRVGQVYLDDQTQEPNWVTVKTGLFGTKEYFVPLDEADAVEKRITVPYDKDTVLGAPFTEIDQNLSPEEEDELYNYYEVPGRTTQDSSLVEDEVDEPKRKSEPETIAPLGTPSSGDSLTDGDTTNDDASQSESASAFDAIVADAPAEADVEAPETTDGASPFESLQQDAAAEVPEHGDSDALSFDAFVDDANDGASDDGASPFERPTDK
jgi:sporulation protein YlmC with PRC-barrel domain